MVDLLSQNITKRGVAPALPAYLRAPTAVGQGLPSARRRLRVLSPDFEVK